MTTEEKAAAFDTLAIALTNEWYNGMWSWWCPTPCGGETVETQHEAVQSLIQWSQRVVKLKAKKAAAMRVHVPLGMPVPSGQQDSGRLPGQGDSKSDESSRDTVGSSEGVRGAGDLSGRPDGSAGEETQSTG